MAGVGARTRTSRGRWPYRTPVCKKEDRADLNAGSAKKQKVASAMEPDIAASSVTNAVHYLLAASSDLNARVEEIERREVAVAAREIKVAREKEEIDRMVIARLALERQALQEKTTALLEGKRKVEAEQARTHEELEARHLEVEEGNKRLEMATASTAVKMREIEAAQARVDKREKDLQGHEARLVEQARKKMESTKAYEARVVEREKDHEQEYNKLKSDLEEKEKAFKRKIKQAVGVFFEEA